MIESHQFFEDGTGYLDWSVQQTFPITLKSCRIHSLEDGTKSENIWKIPYDIKTALLTMSEKQKIG